MTQNNHIFQRIRRGSQASKLADVLISRPASSESRRIATISDMAARGMAIRLECAQCDHAERVAPDALSERFGPQTEISAVRVPCPACGGQAVSVIPAS